MDVVSIWETNSPQQPPHQSALDQLDEQQVGARHADEEGEVLSSGRRKAEWTGQWGEREGHANQDDQPGSAHKRGTWSAAQRVACGPYHEEDERLGSKGFDEPAGVKERFRGSEEREQDQEGQKIVDG